MLTLSLIIPVYNEERHIKACLDAIASQTEMPTEVIVVDNNCTDNTIAIAEAYPFVQIITESTQGLIAARNAGFEHASSDIYGRIDADSQVDPDWVQRVLSNFEADHLTHGLTGYGKTDVLPYSPWPRVVLATLVYFWYVQFTIGVQVMWGANMALRASSWGKIKQNTCLDDKQVHEDQDISLHLLANDMKIVLDKKLRITTSGQHYRYLPKTIYYAHLRRKTVELHKSGGTLLKARKYKISRKSAAVKLCLSAPFILYVWVASIVLFPLDYLLLRLR